MLGFRGQRCTCYFQGECVWVLYSAGKPFYRMACQKLANRTDAHPQTLRQHSYITAPRYLKIVQSELAIAFLSKGR